MELFNIISGVCSIAGLLVSIFTASKVVKINLNCGNKDEHSPVFNENENSIFNAPYAGRDSINVGGNRKQE